MIETYVSRPVRIKAVQWTGKNLGIVQALAPGVVELGGDRLRVPTFAGPQTAPPDYWITKCGDTVGLLSPENFRRQWVAEDDFREPRSPIEVQPPNDKMVLKNFEGPEPAEDLSFLGGSS